MQGEHFMHPNYKTFTSQKVFLAIAVEVCLYLSNIRHTLSLTPQKLTETVGMARPMGTGRLSWEGQTLGSRTLTPSFHHQINDRHSLHFFSQLSLRWLHSVPSFMMIYSSRSNDSPWGLDWLKRPLPFGLRLYMRVCMCIWKKGWGGQNILPKAAADLF